MARGVLTVVSGFAGSGKGTIVGELLKRYSEVYGLSISATTRDPRPNEVHGREYFFKTKEEFEIMIEQGDLIEYASYVGNYYGTPRSYVENQLEAGIDVILEIEVQGAMKIKSMFPDCLLIFITPPDVDTLAARLIGRGTESPEKVAERMQRASEEVAEMPAYDYLIINDQIDLSVNQVHSIIQSSHLRMSQNVETIDMLKKGFESYLKGEF